VINLKTSERTGQVVAIKTVQEDEQLMVITRKGVVNRQRVSEIRVIGRATQGVKLVNLDEGDAVVDVARVVTDDENGVEVDELDGELDGVDVEDLDAGRARADGRRDADEPEDDADEAEDDADEAEDEADEAEDEADE